MSVPPFPPPGSGSATVSPLGALAHLAVAAAGLLTLIEVAQATAAFPASAQFVAAARSGTDVSSVLTWYDATVLFSLPMQVLAWVATCVWLSRARRNAVTMHPGSKQVRGKAWVWWGWLVPVVCLWFPYQVVRDVVTALRSDGSPRRLGVWWSAWVVYIGTDSATSFLVPSSGVPDEAAALAIGPLEAVNALSCLVALVPWVLIVRTVGADQDAAAMDGYRRGDTSSGSAVGTTPAPSSMSWAAPVPTDPSTPPARGRRGSRTMAVWSLVLAVIPVPPAWLGAIALSLTVLVQARRGRGYAIASLVIAPVWILLSIGAIALSYVDPTTPGATSAAPPASTKPGREAPPGHEVSVSALHVGDCLPRGYPKGETSTVTIAPCNQPHLEEVYADFLLPAGPYPGDKRVDRRADGGCTKRFEPYVGINIDYSELDMFYLTPPPDLWPEERRVLCTLTVDSPETGTLRGTRR